MTQNQPDTGTSLFSSSIHICILPYSKSSLKKIVRAIFLCETCYIKILYIECFSINPNPNPNPNPGCTVHTSLMMCSFTLHTNLSLRMHDVLIPSKQQCINHQSIFKITLGLPHHEGRSSRIVAGKQPRSPCCRLPA